ASMLRTAWLFPILFLPSTLMAAGPAKVMPREVNFSTGWVYIPADPAGAERPEFDDSAYERVSVPHANIVTPHETFDPDMFRFVSWYRKRFMAGERFRGKKVVAEFQGVMTVADVYLNGVLVGRHEGGYTGFAVDLAPALRLGRENVLAVRVDSRVQKDVPPEAENKLLGFYLFGGIQRDVVLRVTDPLHIESVYYSTAKIRPEAEENAKITVRNGTAAEQAATVRVRLLDGEGREVAAAEAPVRIAAGAAAEAAVKLGPIKDAKLWDPDHPHRYIAMAEVRRGAIVADRQRTWIGIRQIEWTPEAFRINGQSLKLRGMNRHQTFAYIGGAAPNRLQRMDAQILKYQLGLNMVRGSHYPPDPEFLDECDRIGLLVMDEFPAWQQIGKNRRWQDNAVAAVREMILRDRNHPSIILWGVRANEASPREEDDRDLYARTYQLQKDLDPTRPPCGARLSDAWHGKFVPEEVLTVNDYSDWDAPASWPQPVTARPWFISEFGHPRQFPVWENERELLTFARNWMRYLDGIYSRPDITGGTGWAAFDYNSPEFDTPVAVTAHHCANDIFRLRKGFSAPALASQADPKLYGDMVKILSYWRRPQSELWVASNAEEVELTVNGKTLGRRKPSEYPHLPHPLFLFKLDSFAPGEVTAKAFRRGEPVATDVVRTPGPAARLLVEADSAELVADGADLTRVVVYALDERGTICPREDRRIFVETARGRFLGENPVHLEGGRVAFYVGTKPGGREPVSVAVRAEGLLPDSTTIRVRPLVGEQVPLSDFDLDAIREVKPKGR
ncbi:MAG TPA: glycoside hydrolase family 2 TIM barrel-domain containing protein, partial [Bryobacteraceae bacterium]|nr:glycoside hydrolase family 2 TIM barrel-domain containing protein [Bryobacteraceae bacterium]